MRIGEALLRKQDSVTYLGITVDKHLSWKTHIANVRRIGLGKIAIAQCFGTIVMSS